MKAESQTFQDIFESTVRYAVPLYQRPYVWRHVPNDPEDDRLGPFWDDVSQTVDRYLEHQTLIAAAQDPDKIAPMTPHFFGAVVVDKPVREGKIHTHEVIDGQQRLTTAQLFLVAATRVCEEHDRPNQAAGLRKLWAQDDHRGASGADRLKLRPTRADQAAFSSVMSDPKTVKVMTGERISSAYHFFYTQLSEWVSDIPGGEHGRYFEALEDVVYEHLLLVLIELEPGDNPQGIFESLNAQGEKLLAIDLVKNQVFRSARRADIDLEDLDINVWSARFADEWWRDPVRQGRYRRPRAELFLMHWLTEQANAEVSATGLYVEYLKIANQTAQTPVAISDLIFRFVADAGTYQSFHDLPAGSREWLFFNRREALDAGVVYPVALRLWRYHADSVIDRQQLVAALRALESWLVRRMVLKLTTKPYNKVMVELLQKMALAPNPAEAMISQLQSYASDSQTWWPDDATFRTHLLTQPIYGSMAQIRVRMLLEAIEARMRTTKTESITLQQKLTIEHVIPQSWKTTWPLPEGSADEVVARRGSHIHRLGNLTLITGPLNASNSNNPWTDKREALAHHSVLRLNNRLVADHPASFDENSIDTRSKALAELLVEEWPAPESAEWTITSD
ncbi:DUF262 domain-containing protein [Rhodococcoides fascians]|uniref:DUF262 domain-containing protein n=1 Tax=Rhodococcoides fascians TaxID=1828 RepID=UPI0018AFF9AF|nr:DUF262 domain-containing protein [Rhodococcus fascians]